MAMSGVKLSMYGVIGSVALAAVGAGFATFHDYRRQNAFVDQVVSIYDKNNNGLESHEADYLLDDLIRNRDIDAFVYINPELENRSVKFAGYSLDGSDSGTYVVLGKDSVEIFLGRATIENTLKNRFK